jgi:rhodanese-related sulfurtransferase
MKALAMDRKSTVNVAGLVVMLAIAWYASQPYKAHHVSVPDAISLIDAGAIVIDVRTAPATTLPGALLIPAEALAARMAGMEMTRTQPIIVYCGKGTTLGPKAAHILTGMGYTNVVNLEPGIEGWRKAGLPLVAG